MQTRAAKRAIADIPAPITTPKRRRQAAPRVGKQTPKSPKRCLAQNRLPTDTRQPSIITAFQQRPPLTGLTGTCLARKAFQASLLPNQLPGREVEAETIRNLWLECLEDNKRGALYISGRPGTGKTATMQAVEMDIRRLQANGQIKPVKIIKINCMQLTHPAAIYRTLLNAIGGEAGKKGIVETLEELLCSTRKTDTVVTLILDEVDQLAAKGHDILHRLFEWPRLVNSRLVLIAIANALDLPQRFLTLLGPSENHFRHINFSPYSKDQISAIIRQRLALLQSQPGCVTSNQSTEEYKVTKRMSPVHNSKSSVVFEDSAVEFCARKAAAMSGDARQALGLCQAAMDVAEKQGTGNDITAISRPVHVSIRHMSLAASGQADSTAIASLKSLGLHSQLIIATLAAMKVDRVGPATLGLVRDKYTANCQKTIKCPVSQSEYTDLCELLSAKGLVSIAPKPQDKRLRRIDLQIDEMDVCTALQDNFLLGPIVGASVRTTTD